MCADNIKKFAVCKDCFSYISQYLNKKLWVTGAQPVPVAMRLQRRKQRSFFQTTGSAKAFFAHSRFTGKRGHPALQSSNFLLKHYLHFPSELNYFRRKIQIHNIYRINSRLWENYFKQVRTKWTTKITLYNSERTVIKAINWLLEIFRHLQRIVYS